MPDSSQNQFFESVAKGNIFYLTCKQDTNAPARMIASPDTDFCLLPY